MTWVERLFRRRKMEEQLEKELLFHLEHQTNDLIAKGLDPVEARRLARLELGGPEQVKEQCRDARGTRLLEDLIQDLLYAIRRLRNIPGFTILSVLTLALGIGATTAIFSVVNAVMFEPLPYPQASRLMTIWEKQKDGQRNPAGVTFGSYRGLTERSRSFDSIAVMKPWQPVISGESLPERLIGQRVSANYFRTLGVTPAIGREFSETDDRSGGPNVAIISHSLWQRRFQSDPSIVGRQITLNENSSELTANDSYTVIGLMPPEFENVLSPNAQLWAPLQYDSSLPPESKEWGHSLRMVAKLREGISKEMAAKDADVIAKAMKAEYPRNLWNDAFVVSGLQDDITGSVRPAFFAILGAVVLVLMIACVNVTNLLLARSAQRRSEFAMRAALGARRNRLIRQMLTETLLIGALGGVVGIFVARIGIGTLIALSPPGLPRMDSIGLNHVVFVFGLGMTTLIGVVVGLIPALQSSRTDLRTGIQQGSQRSTANRKFTRSALVVIEVALAIVLLVSSGLLLRSLKRLFSVSPGFDSSQMITMQVQESGHRFARDDVRARFFNGALDAVRQVPGVSSAAFTSQLPLSGDDDEYGVRFEADELEGHDYGYDAFRYEITPGYFETMGLSIRNGRVLDTYDTAGGPPVAVVSESLARLKFPGRDPIGQHLRVGGSKQPWYAIVGVVSDIKQMSLTAKQPEAVYLTMAQAPWVDTVQSLVVRTTGDSTQLASAIRKAIWSADKDQPIVRVATMDELISLTEAQRRFALTLFEAFGSMALVLAAIGIYGVLSGSVSERTREIGIRCALGASRAIILKMVLRQGLLLASLGSVIGLFGALAASRYLISLLYGVTWLDPATYAGVVVLLLAVSSIACLLPAIRAAWVDPSITLRTE